MIDKQAENFTAGAVLWARFHTKNFVVEKNALLQSLTNHSSNMALQTFRTSCHNISTSCHVWLMNSKMKKYAKTEIGKNIVL